MAQHTLCLQQDHALRGALHLAAPDVDLISANDNLTLQQVAEPLLQQPR